MARLLEHVRSRPATAVALGLVAADALVRLVVGAPYPGATLLLLGACGVALLPLVPRELATPTRRLAVLPALALASYSALLVSVAISGIRLTELSIRVAVLAFVCAVVVAASLAPGAQVRPRSTRRSELLAAGVLVGVVAVALASSWDIVYPLQVRGTDLGHYLLYADEVASQGSLLIDDPYAGEEGRVFADPGAVGAVYGSFLILDGISSWTLGAGLVVLSAVSVVGVFAAAAGLWGLGAGLASAGAYAVAPIRLDAMYWHGLGTTFALVFVPLVVFALASMFRGRRDGRTVLLLAAALVGVAAAHATSAVVVAVLVLLAPLVDLVRRALARPDDGVLRSWWRKGVVKPVLASAAAAAVLGAGVIAHVRAQAADLGRPVDIRFLGPDWLDRAAVAGYFSWRFLVLAALAAALVVSSRRLRRDPALLGVLALVLACWVVAESWRVGFPFEYRRVVYYLGIALVLLLGAAFARFSPRPAWIAAWAVGLLAVAQLSIGLRLPERVLAGAGPGPEVVPVLAGFRAALDSGQLPETERIATDWCLHFAVPYLVRRPAVPAFGERQVGFENRLPLARKAAAILEGGDEGRRIAAGLGVRYAIVDPGCVPDLRARLGGSEVARNAEVLVLRLPAS